MTGQGIAGGDEESQALLLWNDDPRLVSILPAELLPEKIGARGAGELLARPAYHELLKSCGVAIHEELSGSKPRLLSRRPGISSRRLIGPSTKRDERDTTARRHAMRRS